MPEFSVIISTYNRRELLRQGLASIWTQTYTNYEIIVVDDGSTDGTWEELLALGPRIRAFRQDNAGPGAARNLGAQHATGEYVAFLDSDDVFFPWSLARYSDVLAAHARPAFITGKPLRFRGHNELSSASNATIRTEAFADYYASGDLWRWWGASSFLIRRDAFEAAGGFTNEWINGEDADLAMRLGTSGGFLQVLAPATFGYREHAVSAMKDLRKTVLGAWYKVRAEQAGEYPGGASRALERWRILTRHLRPVTLDCLRHNLHHDAWGLYQAAFRWHVQLGQCKYLIGFPMKALMSSV
jgi:glycosyltransferase involved in cell wall biosynthesis